MSSTTATLCLLLAISGDDASAAARLLELGWSTPPDAPAYQEALAEWSDGGPSTAYADVLVRIKHRRYREAREAVDALLARHEQAPRALRAQAWLSMLMNQPAEAIQQLDQLVRALPPEAFTGQPNEEQLELMRFVGRMYGYLEGPGSDRIAAASVARGRRRLDDLLADQLRAAMLEGVAEVAEAFAEFRDDEAVIEERAEAEGQQRRERELAEVGRRREENERQRSALDEEAERLREALAARLAEIDTSEERLAGQYAALASQSIVPRRELAAISSEIFRLQSLLDATDDPVQHDSLLFQVNRLRVLASRYESQLLALDAQAAGVQSQRGALFQRRRQTEAEYGAALARVDQQRAALARGERRLEVMGRRAEKIVGRPSGGRARSAAAAALTTYEPFPLEFERRRVSEGGAP